MRREREIKEKQDRAAAEYKKRKDKHLKTGTLKTGASENRDTGKLKHRKAGKQELWKTGSSEKKNS